MLTLLKKKDLRKQAYEIRNKLASSGENPIKSQRIISKILNSSDFINAQNIALYYPIKNEIDITNLLKVQDKNFYLPRCNSNELEFVKYVDDKHLFIGSFGIIEPLGDKINPEILDVIYIPALMANTDNYRLGYGKGFYDRFFAKYNLKAKKIIVLANELINNSFVQDKNDYKCDSIISA